jgi:dihydroneopterin aldolase
MGQILLENMQFYAFHGHYAEEQKIGSLFLVNLSLDTDLQKPAGTDNLEDTIDYSRVHEIVTCEMQVPSMLLEHVAGRIVDSLYRSFKGIEKITVKVTKLNPQMGGKTEGVSIVIIK